MDDTGGGTGEPTDRSGNVSGEVSGGVGRGGRPEGNGRRAIDLSDRSAWSVVNESAAFLVESACFAALCWWGLHVGGVVLAALTLVAAVMVWGMFAAPRARFSVPLAAVLVVKSVILGGGALALWGVGHPVWAVVLGTVVVVNTGMTETGRRRPPSSDR